MRKPLTLDPDRAARRSPPAPAWSSSAPRSAAARLLAVLLLGIVIVFAIADSRAAERFFDVYAAQRGLALATARPAAGGDAAAAQGRRPLRRAHPDRPARRRRRRHPRPLHLRGRDAPTTTATRQTNYYHYTLGLVEVPECVALVPELYCQRKFGLRALEKFEDVFRGSKERVELESEALLDKYEIFARKGQDANWLRQLFSPTFIVWLTDAAPEKFAFELVDGTLCCYVSGHKEDAADLDAIAAATAAVAKRLREEALE